MTLVAGNPDVNFKARLLEGVTLAAAPAPDLLLLDGQQRLTSLFQALKSRAPVCTRDRRGNDLLRHYYANIDACIDPTVDREDEGIVGVPADRRRTRWKPMTRWSIVSGRARPRPFSSGLQAPS